MGVAAMLKDVKGTWEVGVMSSLFHSQAWAGLGGMLWDITRYLCWWVMTGLVVMGASWCAGYGAYSTGWVRAHPPPPLRRRDPVAAEAARGIAQLEALLASCRRAAQHRPHRRAARMVRSR